MNVSIEPVNGDSKKNFKWSFEPLLVHLKLMGINFEPSQPDQNCLRKITCHFSRLICFFLTIGPFFYFKMNELERWSEFIEFGNYQVYSVVIHCGLLTIQQKEKDKIWELIKQIETEFEFSNELFRKFRRLSVAAVLLHVFWVNQMTHSKANVIITF